MPEELKRMRVTLATFKAAQTVRRKYHRISFALRFWQDTGHEVTEAHFRSLVRRICGTEIDDDITRVFFAVFKQPDGRFDSAAMAQTLKYKFGTMSMSMDSPTGPGLLSCLVNCIRPTQP